MKTKWKIVVGTLLAVVAVGGTVASVRWSRSAQVTVQTATAAKGDLTSIVTASGEIKPKTYTNLGANAQGRVMELMVKEGDHVRKGQVVARIESIQANADVAAQKATVASAEADSAASEAGLLVLGVGAHHSVAERLLGSVSERLLRHAPAVPIVLVPSNDASPGATPYR